MKTLPRRRRARGGWAFPPPPPDGAAALAREAGVTAPAAIILWNRGIRDGAAARTFLDADLRGLHDPKRLPGMDRAVGRLRDALGRGERICVHGDYDVDGLSGASLLCSLFRFLGRPAEVHLPTRQDGYGPRPDVFRRLAAQGTKVVVTVDCGVTAHEAIRAGTEAGMDVIVTDHHEPGPELPPALAILDPKLPGSPYPFREVTGAGMAFKLAWGLLQTLSGGARVRPEFRSFLLEATALAALGTVADVAPLVDENRLLVRHGLHALGAAERPGLKALLASCDLAGKRPTVADIGFRIAPRLNAAGRLGDPRIVWEMLTTDDPVLAQAHAVRLDALNRERQRIERAISEEALRRLRSDPVHAASGAVVLADRGWHAGVVGIVAARVVEASGRPAIVLAIEDGVAKGSGRSVPGVDLRSALDVCRDLFHSFGGHAQAVGMRLPADRVDELRARLSGALPPPPPDGAASPLRIDAEIPLALVTEALVRDFDRLSPFGEGNPEPVLAATGVEVAGVPRRVGADGSHGKLFLRQGDAVLSAIAFGMGDRLDDLAGPLDAAFVPRHDTYAGGIQAELLDFRPAGGGDRTR